MPMMDLRVALTNPYTLDKWNVLRRALANNGYGEPVLTSTTINNVRGVVHPASPNDLKRLPEDQVMEKTMVFISKFALRSASKDNTGQAWQADVCIWGGSNFLVQLVEDYSQYGRGFIRAICGSMTVNDPPPVTQ